MDDDDDGDDDDDDDVDDDDDDDVDDDDDDDDVVVDDDFGSVLSTTLCVFCFMRACSAAVTPEPSLSFSFATMYGASSGGEYAELYLAPT